MASLFLFRIIGLYVSLVIVIGQFVRTLTSDSTYTIMFEELPDVDRIFRICKDLYLVRESGELQLEEDLFSKLIFLFRFVFSSSSSFYSVLKNVSLLQSTPACTILCLFVSLHFISVTDLKYQFC